MAFSSALPSRFHFPARLLFIDEERSRQSINIPALCRGCFPSSQVDNLYQLILSFSLLSASSPCCHQAKRNISQTLCFELIIDFERPLFAIRQNPHQKPKSQAAPPFLFQGRKTKVSPFAEGSANISCRLALPTGCAETAAHTVTLSRNVNKCLRFIIARI